MSIGSELRQIQAEAPDGILRVANAHDWAYNHPKSDLYRALEWDDAKAGYQFRLVQIRHLISVHIRTEEGKREVLSLSIDRVNVDGGYRQVEVIMRDQSLRTVALQDAFAELERIREKYQWLTELAKVWEAVDAAKPKRRRASRRDKGDETRSGTRP